MSIYKIIEYKDNSGNVFEGEVYIPERNGQVPGVLIFPGFRGITDFERKKAKFLADRNGYVAFIADVYGKGIRPTATEEAFAVLKTIVSERTTMLKPRLEASLRAMQSLKHVNLDKMATLGFCFGGMCALDMARYNYGLKAAVSFHGTLLPVPGVPLDPIMGTSVQAHHGDRDEHLNPQVAGFHEEMRTRQADFMFINHSHAQHGFTQPESDNFNSPGVGYHQRSAKRSMRMAIGLLREVFI